MTKAGRKKEFTRKEPIAKKIKELVQNKVPIEYIISYCLQNYEGAPNNRKMLYELYGDDIKGARAEAINEVGSKVYQQATKESHFPSQELYLKTQEDWSSKEKIEIESGDEDNSAIGAIMALLGKKKKQDE